MSIRFSILTVSDRSALGTRPDESGPALAREIFAQGWVVRHTAIVADESEEIRTMLSNWCATNETDVILTTGGTGLSPRDVTPEATLQVVDRLVPGLAEAMRAASVKITPHAMLSRGVCGTCGRTLIINLPGSPKAAIENLQTIASVLPHAVSLLKDSENSEADHRKLDLA